MEGQGITVNQISRCKLKEPGAVEDLLPFFKGALSNNFFRHGFDKDRLEDYIALGYLTLLESLERLPVGHPNQPAWLVATVLKTTLKSFCESYSTMRVPQPSKHKKVRGTEILCTVTESADRAVAPDRTHETVEELMACAHDGVDITILLLKSEGYDSTEIGVKLGMTGQAVTERIRFMKDRWNTTHEKGIVANRQCLLCDEYFKSRSCSERICSKKICRNKYLHWRERTYLTKADKICSDCGHVFKTSYSESLKCEGCRGSN